MATIRSTAPVPVPTDRNSGMAHDFSSKRSTQELPKAGGHGSQDAAYTDGNQPADKRPPAEPVHHSISR